MENSYVLDFEVTGVGAIGTVGGTALDVPSMGCRNCYATTHLEASYKEAAKKAPPFRVSVLNVEPYFNLLTPMDFPAPCKLMPAI
jgi:hypothetical protein